MPIPKDPQETISPARIEELREIFKTNMNQAVEKYNYSLEFNPENPEVYYWRAVAYWHQNKLDLAEADLKQSCDLGYKDACDRYDQVKNQWAN